MADFTLYLGNKNYSSWSMRGWLAIRHTGVAFDEHTFDLSRPDVRTAIRRVSPAGKVPALGHGDTLVWDSLAICEYLAELFPRARLWPEDRDVRARARSVSAEMHSGFPVLRRAMPLNVRRSSPGKGRVEGIEPELERIREIWNDCRARSARSGGYLFGEWSIADIMFAPVVSRFRTYAVEVDAIGRAYMDLVWGREDVTEWSDAARAEAIVESQFDL